MAQQESVGRKVTKAQQERKESPAYKALKGRVERREPLGKQVLRDCEAHRVRRVYQALRGQCQR